MMVRAFIVDDEPPARVRLRQLLSDAGGVIVVGEAGDAIEARTAIADSRPDVVFLDIEMPETSGTELAASLPEPRPFVVFATAFDHYALAAFAVDATDYLVKPITRARLAGTLARVRERLSRRSDLERDLVAAAAAQAMLLGRHLPSIDGYDTAALTVPARGVGGDFFLSQQVGPTRFVLALGDVSGKGMPAGIVASSLQARIEAVARHARGTASEVMTDVNRALCDTSEGARYATLAYLELDTERSRLLVINAGHPPLLVVTPDRPIRFIDSTAPALGLFPEGRFEACAVPLGDGAMVVSYSDGVTESLDPEGVEFAHDRLCAVVARYATGSASDVCNGIFAAVRAHVAGDRATDDVTVLVVKKQVGSEGP
jgi:serine phosphatase RsbU (regulator of sigma subunit)